MSEERMNNFISEIIDEDLAAGRADHVHTRFPPEPNGYLHIGHCKALMIDFGMAQAYGDALARLYAAGRLVPGGLAVLEREKSAALALPQGFEIFDTRVYGDTAVDFARASAE